METIYEGAKETAKKIRVALKETFPGVKFSVRSQTYSGGSSVNVSWTDLPLREDVEEVVNRFKSGSFDGMTDMYETSGYIENGVRYVGAKYISCSRELSDEYRAEIETYLHANYEVSKNHYEYYRYMNKAEKEMIEAANQETTQEEVSETIETVEVTESNPTDITLKVVMNDEKKGIELYFSSKPSQNVRKMLSENGFRWSKRGFWYAKQTQERLSLADAIQSILAETNQLVSNVIAETEELMQEEAVFEDTYNTIENDNKTVVLKEIEFVWSESGDIEDGLKVTTFAEAEAIIRNAAKHAPDNGCYDKTKFNIVWSDGQNYEGRFDIVRSDMFKATPLKSHIESFVNDVIEDDGTWYSNERKEDYKHFINTYPLEDAQEPTNEPNGYSKESNVLDFTSKMKAKQEKEEASKMMDSFLTNILPNMTREEQLELMDAYKTGKEKDIETIFNKILLSVSIRQAKEEVFSKNKL